MSASSIEKVAKGPTVELFARYFHAYRECSDEVQAGIREMIDILNDPASDAQDRLMAVETIAEAMFPGYDGKGLGIDIEEADRAASENTEEGRRALAALDEEEAVFAERLADAMARTGLTQEELARRIGVGQPAISMMLSRTCRPQRSTVEKIAAALGVKPSELWPFDD